LNAWGLLILAAGALLVLLGITGKADNVLNGARLKSGNPTKSYA
jgi:hypothetical protein